MKIEVITGKIEVTTKKTNQILHVYLHLYHSNKLLHTV
jgi:hypothetical protein